MFWKLRDKTKYSKLQLSLSGIISYIKYKIFFQWGSLPQILFWFGNIGPEISFTLLDWNACVIAILLIVLGDSSRANSWTGKQTECTRSLVVKTVRGRTSETKVPFYTTISQRFCRRWAWETEDQWGTRPCWSLTLLSESLCWPAAPQLGLNDYRPLALTSVVMEILQETGLDLLDRHICSLQFACWAQRSVYDAGNMVVQHSQSTHKRFHT